MRGRDSTEPVDKVCAIALPLQKSGFHCITIATLPIYDPNTAPSTAWEQLISSIASTNTMRYDVGQPLHHPTIQLLCLFPHPSRHHWFPSWTQLQKYPDVSVTDNDPVLVETGSDCSLHIMYGRIYHGCSLQLIQPPTPHQKAIYHSTMGGRCAQLVATAPDIEPNIDSGTKYVLVDISPDCSRLCKETGRGHEHRPIWQKSVILICEQVDSLEHPAFGTGLEADSLVIIKYHLRRVTTLEWDCRQSSEPGPGCWLPFEPSLVHIRSVVCSARGGRSADMSSLPHVFCDPALVPAPWRRRCPAFEVYLV